MTLEQLLGDATRIKAPSPATADEYAGKRDALAAAMNKLFLARPDVERLVGKGNVPMMEDNHRNHARFMESVFLSYDPSVLVETVLWVFRAYRNHGFQLAYWPAQLDTWVELLRRDLSPAAFAEVYPFYHWMLTHQAAFVSLSDELVCGPMPSHGTQGK